MWIKNIVADLKSKFDTSDPFTIASCLNIIVLELDLHEEINGFYKYDRKNKYIVLNSHLEDSSKPFVCSHELGHAVLHPRANTPFMIAKTLYSVDRIEREANRFAAELLIPDESLKSCEQMTLNEVASRHNVPVELVELKCEKLFI